MWRSPGLVATVATLAVATAALIAYERARGRDRRRYFSRAFLTDVEYAIFYNAGVFGLFWLPLYRLFSAVSFGAAPRLFAHAHPVLQIVVFMLVADLALYWKHRLMHAVPALWRIHAIHHSQTSMTLMTTFRFHAADELLNNTIRFAAGLLLGVPPNPWLPLTIAMTMYQSLQHSDTGWSFGILDRLFVSSRFHNVHHSIDATEARGNFGQIFSAWDFLFGTASAAERPAAYGVADLDVPESFVAQLWFPFARHPRREDAKPVQAAVAQNK